jgi:cytochrome c oxidase subunit 2
MQVRVVGQQFAWTYYYADGGKQIESTQLVLPVNRPVHFTLQSKDVIHDFWVPAFRIKRDVVRGIDTEIRVTPNRTGTFDVVCAELCGLGHAAMRSNVRVVSQGQFNAFMSKLRSGGGTTAGGGGSSSGGGASASTDAKTLFTTAAQPVACGSCHTLADAGTHATTGPDLDKALKGKSPAFIKQSIVNPNAQIAPGYTANIMPQTFGQSLKPAQLAALVKYLSEVTK